MPSASVVSAGLVPKPHGDAVAHAEAMAERHLARVEEVERVRKFVHWTEGLVRVPGTRFGIGLDAILGAFVPGLGDAIGGALALTVLVAAVRRGVPRIVVARMLVNVLIDVVGGLVPVAGDVFDVLWRANTRNLDLLERHSSELEPRARPGDWAIVGVAVAALAAGLAAPFFLIAWLLSMF